MRSPFWPRSKLVPLLVAIAATGCSDWTAGPPRETHAPTAQEPRILSAGGIMVPWGEMQAIHTRLVREVALSLRDPQLRRSVYDRLRTSPYPEGKLHFRTVLATDRAFQDRLTAVAATPNQALSALDSIVDLEFYMPVPEHRARWTGDDDLLVAGVLRDDGTIPVGFDLDGARVTFASAEVPPTTPTLVIVPVETDFSRDPQAVDALAGAQSSGTPGVYLTRAKILDDYEGWGMGAPEFEAHAFVERNGNFEDVSCAGEKRVGSSFFWNHDDVSQWFNGNVLVATESAIGNNRVEVQIWEDDTGPCQADGGRPPDTDGATLQDIRNLAIAIVVVSEAWVSRDSSWRKYVKTAAAAPPIALSLGNIIHDDDLVGVAHGPTQGCWPASGPASFDLRAQNGGATKGWVSLDYRFGTRDPLCQPGPPPLPAGSVNISGPSMMQPYDFCFFSGSATNGTPPYTYRWSRNGSTIGYGSQVNVSSESNSFELVLEATDATGRVGTASRNVTVTSNAPICFQ